MSQVHKIRFQPVKASRLSLILELMLVGLLAMACGPLRARNPVPEELVQKAQIPGMDEVRILANIALMRTPNGPDEKGRFLSRKAQQAASKHIPCCSLDLTGLSLSGGGANGAFSAGILLGWTESGNRPQFDIVTGISTGALQAPFAFLGPEYDDALKVYTNINNSDVYKLRTPGTILQRRDALADFTPLKELIERLFGEAEMEAVAREYMAGRRLYIGTTYLDAQQPVFWDMGAIAASGHPKALEIFRKVMIASASVPIAVPPVYFDVEVDGKRYEEMHVDGGITTQVFGAKLLRFSAEAWQEADYEVTASLYLIRNSRFSPEYESVKAKIAAIGGRTVSTLIKSQGFGDIFRAYLDAIDAGIDFNYLNIPSEFNAKPKEEFDPVYMKALFEFGYQMAKNGLEWKKYPPGFMPSKK